jgi:hypothetical protein
MIVSAYPMPDPTVIDQGPGQFDAATAADIFITWLQHRVPHGVWTADGLADLRGAFSEDTGIPTPRARTFLGAIKRHGGMAVRQDVRIYGSDGTFHRKATVYGFTKPPGRISLSQLSACVPYR